MIEAYTGDFGEIETIMATEEVFSFEFPETFWDREENPGDLKFKDVVNYIMEQNRNG